MSNPSKKSKRPRIGKSEAESFANATLGAVAGGLIAGPVGVVVGAAAGALVEKGPEAGSGGHQEDPRELEIQPRPQTDTTMMRMETIISPLKKAYAAELETVQNYLANSVWLDGLRARDIAAALAEDVTEELGHARKLAHRLKQLGACPPGSLAIKATQKSLQPPADSTDLRQVVQGTLDAERAAIATHLELIAVCDGVDPVTQDLATQILADEEGHRTLFEGFLKSLENGSGG